MRSLILALSLAVMAPAQVFSPKVLSKGQPDPTNLARFSQGIYAQARAVTPRQRAEAIWRYFLTDGRFVPPGLWYHIAGWAYEEPMGELLDPLKLINSYGFGLCYQIAPLLEAVYRAGGFEDARVWFLTGHTVTEVFYDGAYHHYDSDMLGYTTLGDKPAKVSTVASVHQLEMDGGILLSKLKGPRDADSKRVDYPWYPADVRAGAMDGLAELFTTTSDNSLFPYERAPQGYSPEFVLRPNERLVRYFSPERPGLFYLPYKFDGTAWTEFPKDDIEYKNFVADGPHSQKDERKWGTGFFEYRPKLTGAAEQIFKVQSPYVIIDAEFLANLDLKSNRQSVVFETSSDNGRTWTPASRLSGPHQGPWRGEPAVLTKTGHGRRTAVSGTYGYLIRLTANEGASAPHLVLRTRIQLNPRTLPTLAAGHNELVYSSGPDRRRLTLNVSAKSAQTVATRLVNASYVEQGGQGYWVPTGQQPAEVVFKLAAPQGQSIVGFDIGGRFLDLGRGIAPDKFTAEVRRVEPVDSTHASASIAWSLSAEGPFQTIWEYDPKLVWKDGVEIDRMLRWPEVDRHVEVERANAVYARYLLQGLAIDDFRLALQTQAVERGCLLELTHVYSVNGVEKTASEQIPAGVAQRAYSVDTPPGAKITNQAFVIECK